MQFKEVLNSSGQALKGNKLRTGLTMLGIVIGISSVILISSIGQGAVAYIHNQLSVFGSNIFRVAPGKSPFTVFATTNNPLTTRDFEALKRSDVSNIDQMVPVAITTRNISGNDKKTTSSVYGMSSSAQNILKPDILYGEFIPPEVDDTSEHVAIIGVNIAEDFFGVDTDPVGQSIRIDSTRYRIIGVSKSTGIFGNFFNNGINIPINTMIDDVKGKDELLEIVFSVKDETQIKQTMLDVEDFLRDYRKIPDDEDNDFFTQGFSETLNTITTVTSLLSAAVAAISGISLLVGGIGIMNIMLVSVTERTREIGLLKAIGAREQDILSQFLLESITLSLTGGFIGIALGVAGSFLISLIAHIPFVVSPTTIFIAVLVSTLVGVVFGIFPARRAAHLHPIDALRFE